MPLANAGSTSSSNRSSRQQRLIGTTTIQQRKGKGLTTMPSSLVLLDTHLQQPIQVVSTETNNNTNNITHDVAATDGKDDPSCLNDNSPDIQRELQDRLQVIVTLRNTVVQQRERVALLKQTNRSQKRQMNILRSALNNNNTAAASTSTASSSSSSSSPSTSSSSPYMHMRWEELSLCELLEQDALQQERPRVVTFGPTFSKTDSILLSNLPRGTVGMDHDEESKTDDTITMTNNDCFANPSFQQTHTSLEQHARKTETVLALAQLETAQQTINSLRQELQQSETEREQLQQDLQQSQEDIATAKLQAELARADAQQWQYDNTVLREERDRAITEQRATQERLHRLFVFVGQQHQKMDTANSTTASTTAAGPHKPNPATVQASNDNDEKQQDCIDKTVADDSHESGPSQPRRLWSSQEETSDDNDDERHDQNNKGKAVNVNTTESLPKKSVGVNTTNNTTTDSTNAATETSRMDTETNSHELKAVVVAVDTAAAALTTTTTTKNAKQPNPSSVQTTAARKRFAKPTSASSSSANTTVRASRSKATDKEKRRSVSVRKERSSSTTRTPKQQSQQPNRKGGFLARLSSPFGLADSHNQHKSSSKVGKRRTSIASMSSSKNSIMTTTPRKRVQVDSTLKQQHTPSTVASEGSSYDLSNHDGNDNNNDGQYFEDEYGMPLQGVQV